MTLSTHVLDASTGRPACKLPVSLDRRSGDSWVRVGNGMTDDDGRCQSMAPDGPTGRGLPASFDTGCYFSTIGQRSFYPEVAIVFEVTELDRHHVPLLLSPFAYSTYRGS